MSQKTPITVVGQTIEDGVTVTRYDEHPKDAEAARNSALWIKRKGNRQHERIETADSLANDGVYGKWEYR